ncbi:MAG: glycosyltransferase family 2 protein [Synergistaceae bacterium]|nr:glycosyltransferase family 2 protein [Synergistaceae bacterium]
MSVLVPVYNTEKYLARCVDSILSQTYPNIELILTDDGSTDSSPAMCDDFARKDSRVRVIHTENRGASAARNTALDTAMRNTRRKPRNYTRGDHRQRSSQGFHNQ